MRKIYEKPQLNIENFLMDMDIMSGITKEMLEFYYQQFEELCASNGMEANEDNWNMYKSLLDVSIPYCYHTANMFS